jgi:hypothetical protein
MSNRKNYNSIVFLTTLSVYLGLVLVGGATPSVLAQAALTRDFDIKNEIVVEDDLDKKPDDETFSELKNDSGQADRQFIEQYAETILALLKTNYLAEKNSSSEIKIKASGSFADDEEFRDFFPTLRKDFVIDGFDYALDKDKLFGKLNLKSRFNNNISPAGYSYISGLNFLRTELRNKPETVILKNTEINFENNQVFIVTRLPRASIDDLLAGK